MKYSFVALTALATAVMAKPAFTNEDFTVVEGQPFEFTFTGCSEGCTIYLKNGSSKDLKTVETIVADVDSGSFTWTPKGLPSDTYAFEIKDKEGVSNWSPQWEYKGTGKATQTEAPTATETEEATTSTKSTKKTTTKTTAAPETTITTVVTSSEAATTVVSTESAEETTTEAAESTTEAETEVETETDAEPTSSPTTVPDNAAMRSTTSLALVAGAIMAFALLN